MTEDMEMNAPATKGDLKTLLLDRFAMKDDLKRFATKADLNRFATKDDLKRFATKDDLKRFATKDDLKRFATKDDLKRFATKADLKCFASKDDLNGVKAELSARLDGHDVSLRRLTAGFAVMQCDITALKAGMGVLHSKLDRVTTTLEGFASSVETLMRKIVFQGDMLMGHEARIRSLERRPQ